MFARELRLNLAAKLWYFYFPTKFFCIFSEKSFGYFIFLTSKEQRNLIFSVFTFVYSVFTFVYICRCGSIFADHLHPVRTAKAIERGGGRCARDERKKKRKKSLCYAYYATIK